MLIYFSPHKGQMEAWKQDFEIKKKVENEYFPIPMGKCDD